MMLLQIENEYMPKILFASGIDEEASGLAVNSNTNSRGHILLVKYRKLK